MLALSSRATHTVIRYSSVLLLALSLAWTAPTAVDARGAPDSFADLAEKLSPAVVNISTTQTMDVANRPDFEMPEIPPGSPFEDFFKDFFDERMQRGPRKATSLGSGFVIDSEGFVVTNNHVIDDADEITVKFSDGLELPAEVLGRDAKTDLALLKVTSDDPLPFVPFGDSDAARVGDWVMAIGNPFGLGGTVTVGIVSARNRDINSGPYDDYIQTDASINRGNSGGPLFNMDGQVIGVNTAIYSPSGGSIGIGFSIPSTIVKSIISQLKEFGETRRGWLGVRIQAVTKDIAEAMDMSEPKGALVAGVDDKGPAKAAGLETGDVIVTFDGKDVPEMRDLPRIVAETEVGRTVKVDVIRDGKQKTYDVKIDRLNEGEQQVASLETDDSEEGDANTSEALGMTLSLVNDLLREQYGLDEDAAGVIVTDIDFESDAADKVRPGDIIEEVGNEPVSTPEEVIARVDELTGQNKKKPILLLLNRGGERTFRPVRPDSG